MKHIGNAAAVAILISLPAFSQAPAPKAPAAAPAPAMKAEKVAAQSPADKPARKSRASEDARACLQHATNREVAVCAEDYR